ncbi:MAG: transposase [Lachnospiraceae bacterium]|nr:transposase [Lachnospiraceae bacterium]
MSSIPQNTESEQQLEGSINKFISTYKLRKLLISCNAGKEKGVPIMKVFRYLLCIVFADRSMYMQLKTDAFKEDFSKNTIYRFLDNPKTNWQKFTTLLSEKVINGFFRRLTSDERSDVFIIDDSLFDRSTSKKTDMLAKVFDHCDMKYKKGFRLLTLGWSDGNSFIPVNHCLLSASKDENLLYAGKQYDGRSLAAKRREQSRRKATDVMIELLKSALKSGHQAKYVLFDSWFSSPKTITAIKEQFNLDTIAMVKISSKVFYEYKGERLSVKQIYSRNRKRRGRSKYLLSLDVMIGKDNDKIPAKIVCVRNKSNKKDWLAIISTDTTLSEEEIIRIYGKRWKIEVFFKTCKSYLKLVKETRSTSYDALNAHVALVFTRYMIISISQRCNEDPKTICEIFYYLANELADITFNSSLKILMQAMLDTVTEFFHITEEQLADFTSSFINRLPNYMKDALNCVSIA